jgi:hypothetical protein
VPTELQTKFFFSLFCFSFSCKAEAYDFRDAAVSNFQDEAKTPARTQFHLASAAPLRRVGHLRAAGKNLQQ